MIAISIADVRKIIASFEDDIDILVDQRVKKLQNLLDTQIANLDKAQKAYLENLIQDLPELVVAVPDELEFLSRSPKYCSLPTKLFFYKSTSKGKRKKKSFKQELEHYIDYSGFRSAFLPKYFAKIGIKACIYCNSQLTIAMKLKNGITKARFQVDHYLPKATYPCFGISLFNFYPSCASCNLVKSDKDSVRFKLYSDDPAHLAKSAFSFQVKDGMLSMYILSKNVDDLVIEFIEKDPSTKFEDTFDIKGIYDTQKDVAEELIWRRQIYTPSYKEFLRKEFKVLYNDPTLSDRFIVGNYSCESDIHKRPMAKFMQDIARQIGLLEDDAPKGKRK